MKLYWCPQTRSVRILWLLEEAGIPYDRLLIDIRNEEARSEPAFRAISPMGKVPAFEDGAVRLWDSGAICTYVADQYPDAHLGIPVGHPERGEFLQWVMFTNSVVEPAMGEKFSGMAPAPSRYGWGSWDLMLATFRAAVAKGPFVLGDHFTAADVMLGSSAHFMRAFKMLTDDPVLFAYADRCAARPAFQRAYGLEAAAVAGH